MHFPVFKKRLRQYRGLNSSHEYNLDLEDIFYDINNLFNMAEEINGIIDETRTIMYTQNRFYQKKLAELKAEVENLQTPPNDDGTLTLFIPATAVEIEESDSRAAFLDPTGSFLSLKARGDVNSKLYLHNLSTGKVLIPDDVEIDISPQAGYIVDNKPERAIDSNSATCWLRRVILPEADIRQDFTTTFTITIPASITYTSEINGIDIEVFPLNGLDIDNIEYYNGQNWQQVDGFTPIHDASVVRLIFPPVTATAIRLQLRQRYPVIENHSKIFYFGIRNLNIYYTEWENAGNFIVPLNLGNIKEITKIEPILLNATALSDKTTGKKTIFNYSIYRVLPDGNLEYVNDTLPASINAENVIIKAQLQKDMINGVAPVLTGLKITIRQ